MSGRFLFVFSALLLFAGVALGEGDYQRTKDGKTTVWNAEPKPGDEATWFGDRDSEGYAAGVGTLTWHTGREQTVRRLGIPITKSDVYARYFGNMVRGKFNGLVNVHSKGKTGHATFVDGKRTSRWVAGPAPSRSELAANAERPITRALPVEPGPEQPAAKTEKSARHAEPVAPAAEPSAAPRANDTVAKTEKSSPRPEPAAPAAGPLQYKRAEVSDQKSASSTNQPSPKSKASRDATAASEVRDQAPEVSEQTSEVSLLHAKPVVAASETKDQTPEVSEQTSEASLLRAKPATAASEDRDQRSASSAKVTAASEISDQKSDQAADAAKRDADHSLRLLAGPPSSLHVKPVNEGSPASANADAAPSSYTNARLTKEEVADFADAEARSRGYDLSDYQRMDPQYFPADEIWTLGYNGTREIEKHFSVTIDDKTKGRVFVPGK